MKKLKIRIRAIFALPLAIGLAFVASPLMATETAAWDSVSGYYRVTKNNFTWYFEIHNAGACIQNVSPYPSGVALNIPSNLADYPVVAFNADICPCCSALDNGREASPLTSLTLPNTIQSIGDESYFVFGCQTRLRRLTIPASVNYIGDEAFAGLDSSCTVLFEGDRPGTGGDIFGAENGYSSHPEYVYFKANTYGWTNGGTWNGVTTLLEGSKFVTITYNGNGGAVRTSSKRCLSGRLFGKMQTPIRNGYMFVGWYTAASGGNLVTASTAVPDRNTTYYAHWAPILSLATSLNSSGMNWSSDSWHGQAVDSYDGTSACRSGSISDGRSTYLQTTVTGPGTISFWWKVSCEGDGCDALRFLVDSNQEAVITGETGWRYVSINVSGSGTHRLKWNYTKDGSITKGQDCGWVDQVRWTDNKVTINFSANGGSVRSRSVRAQPGNLWGKMQTPTRSGYMFVGWYTSNGSLVTASTEVPSYSTTYYARWTPILSLGRAADSSLAFTSDSWHGQSVDSHDGSDSIRSGSIGDGRSTYLSTTVYGSGYLSFYWKVSCEGSGCDGLRLLVDSVQQEMITGEVGWNYVRIPISGSGRHEIKWNYTKDWSVTKGQDCGWVDQVQWTASTVPGFAEALDTTATSVYTSGSSDWFVENSRGTYGGSCIRSGSIDHSQNSTIEVYKYCSGRTYYFDWYVSSESNFDKLSFWVDGVKREEISGESGWQTVTVYLSQGFHTLEWRYAKDGSVSSGSDCGWVDHLR